MRGYRNGHYRYFLLCRNTTHAHGHNQQEVIMKVWNVILPEGELFQVYGDNEKHARIAARFYLGVEKLPKGTEVVSV